VYADLRHVAQNQLRFEPPGHTLQPTALVNETYLRLVGQERIQWRSRAQFFAVAAQLIRRILVDHARHRNAAKRGGMATRLQLDSSIASVAGDIVDAIALDTALKGLEALDAQQARVIELRFYGGLSIEETASALGVSPATVNRDWVTAKAWLYRQLQDSIVLAENGA
jgi:RNA polymerase sigma factor (TIGR02999 family)